MCYKQSIYTSRALNTMKLKLDKMIIIQDDTMQLAFPRTCVMFIQNVIDFFEGFFKVIEHADKHLVYILLQIFKHTTIELFVSKDICGHHFSFKSLFHSILYQDSLNKML